MMENVIVGVIVGTVLFFSARSFYRILTGKSEGCGCGTQSCPATGRCNSLEVAMRKAQTTQEEE